MTYCVGLRLDRGLVFMSDTRTNAGVDSIATFRKMRKWVVPGERVLVLLAAGNLATTQAVVSLIDERTKAPEDRAPSMLQAPSMYQTARMVGDTIREVVASSTPAGQKADAFSATFILGGQIKGTEPRLFMIYPEGNFIEATDDTPFLQIGEHKYGKPILDRVVRPSTSLEDGQKAVLLSMDSTLRSNLSVGMPLDLALVRRDECRVGQRRRIEAGDDDFRRMSEAWSEALRDSFARVTL